MNRHPRLRAIARVTAIAIAFAVLSGAAYETAMRRQAVRDFRMPGRLVDVGAGRRIQIDCRGSGSPTVVLESGLDANGSLSWALVHDSIANTTRVCAYSRAGIMWSDPSTRPFSSEGVARDLRAALGSAGETGPFVLVAHSLGGPYAMMFTKLFPADVVGLVLVDASHPDQFERFRDAIGKSLQPTTQSVAIGDALAWTGLVRLLRIEANPTSWPAGLRREASAFFPSSLHALRRETGGIPTTLASVSAARSLADRPLVVLSAGLGPSPDAIHQMGITAEQGARVSQVSRTLREDEAAWSSRGRHVVVSDAGHYIQFDRPDAVIRAVRDVLLETQSGRKQ